jgi:hypothetical protein
MPVIPIESIAPARAPVSPPAEAPPTPAPTAVPLARMAAAPAATPAPPRQRAQFAARGRAADSTAVPVSSNADVTTAGAAQGPKPDANATKPAGSSTDVIIADPFHGN